MNTDIVWCDVETTGLGLSCRLLEIALVITDKDLKEKASYQTVVDSIGRSILSKESPFWTPNAFEMHEQSGLLEELQRRFDHGPLPPTLYEAQSIACEYIDQYEYEEPPILGGSSVHFDRAFLYNYMPELHKRLHYRNLDVSSIGHLAKIWDYPQQEKNKPHRAEFDIRNSINELEFYRENMFR